MKRLIYYLKLAAFWIVALLVLLGVLIVMPGRAQESSTTTLVTAHREPPSIDMEMQYRYQVLRADIAEMQVRLAAAQTSLRATAEAISAACGTGYTANENPQTRKLECVAKPVK